MNKCNKSKGQRVVLISLTIVIAVLLYAYPIPKLPSQSLYGQTPANIRTASPFHSVFDTFVVPDSAGGYGVYEPKSNIFKPNDRIVLYIEPIGFSYNTLRTEKGETLYELKFTADFTLYDETGKRIISGQKDIPISQIISHHKNKELFLIFTLDPPKQGFPSGNYLVKYTIHDVPSGNSFDITKKISIANG
jgi:hypothetical protein